ncbi:MAG: phage tail tape measure protein, partial [Lachnospiraceae bacterium]|nr:phage tail tape measure protein [Lachnospiraceae bacterium]
DDLMEIADTIEMVSQNMAYDFASGIDEIASGIEQSGSVAKSAGLSLQEYVSMLGLVIEKTGQSGSTIGNAYKTILQRITKASAMEGTLEEDISAAEKSLRAVGVEVRNTADEFRDLTDIMSDLGKVWDSLSSVEQSNISYNVAGVRQTNILKSLLGYWEDYESLVEKANDASGTTLKNQEIYVESLQGKLGKLSAIWSNISNDTISSNFLKGLADAGIGISSIIEKIGLLKSVIASVGIAAFVKNFNHLKEVGASISALNEIQRVFNNTALVGEQLNLSLAGSLSTYSVETVKAAIAQGTFTAEQIKAILTAKGLTDAEIQEVITTNALTASQTGATASTFGLGTAFKGLGLSIKTATKSMIAWMATNPIGWITAVVSAIGASIYGVVKLHDALTVSLEEQKEKLQETKEAYENVKNELQEVETELQNTQNKVEELENTPNLTWVDQEELNRLREVTKELELQKQLKQDAQLESAKDLYKENEKTFDKEFKSSYGNTSVSDLKEQLSSGQIGIGQLDYKNITDIVTALQYINEEKAKLTDESEIAEFEDFINDLTDLIKSDGQEYLSSLSEYKQNILEIASIRDLTQDEQDFYDYLSSMQKAIYEYYSPAAWNNLEFDSIFDTEGIEKTKEELVSMYKSGELSSAEMLEQFPKLNQAIKESEIIAGESSDVYKEFFNEIAALAEGQADVVNDVMEETKASLSITETVDQINTQLKPAFDSLKSAYEDIFSLNEDTGEKLFSLDDVDINTFESIRAQLEKLGEIDGITIDYSPFERFVSVLSDTSSTAEEVQQQFDNLA